MAGLAPVDGAAATFLAGRRDDLNRRFERARKRWPRLDGAAFLALIREVVAPLAGDEAGAGELCSSVYDVALLHAGRDTLANPGVAHLLRHTLPALRPLLLARPTTLPAALSNAVENLGGRGLALSLALGRMAPGLPGPDALLDACLVVAWRLGEARLRAQALVAAHRLPASTALAALDLDDWPAVAAPAALAALGADGWTHPRDAVSQATLRGLRTDADGASLAHAIAAAPRPAATAWTYAGAVGDFEGFGGAFPRPPWVSSAADRHTFVVRTGDGAEDHWRVCADLFGSVATRVPPDDAHRRGDRGRPAADGTLAVAGRSLRLPALAGARSCVVLDDLVIASHADSHRLRVFVPRGPAR